MLYTSYIAKLNKLPKDITKILITRFPPKYINIKDYENLYLMKELSPSQELLLRYKQDNNWDNYIRDFNSEMLNREGMKDKINKLLRYLNKGNDVMLVCFEKDYTHCHRYLLAQYFIEQGIEWKEY